MEHYKEACRIILGPIAVAIGIVFLGVSIIYLTPKIVSFLGALL